MRTHQKIPKTQESRSLRGAAALLTLALSSACGPTSDQEALGEISQALNVCNETVPADQFVDGLPAYDQCDSTTGAIWSNNGIDTSTSSQGADWVRTQFGGGYQCTEWAWRYMYFKWGVDYRSGNAGSWCDGELPSTLTKATVPVHGDLIVFAPGSCGADATTGHVAVIDTVNSAAGTVTLVEQNPAGRRNSKLSCGLCFLHAVANDGSASGGSGGTAGGGGSASAGGAGGSGGNGGSSATAGSGGGGSGGSGLSGGSSGLAGGGGTATVGGASSAGGATASGGSTVGGAPSVGTGGTAGASGNGGASAGTSASGPEDDASCSVGPSLARTASGAPFVPYFLLLAGLAARRSMLRRKAESTRE